MKKQIKNVLDRFMAPAGLKLIKEESLEKLLQYKQAANEFSFLQLYPERASEYLKFRKKSKAQLRQDLFVLLETGFIKNGYFIEFGATDGESLSNTYLLEKEFKWSGILAEPGKIWHEDLKENRNCHIDTGCVWSTSGDKIKFKEVELASLSTAEGFGENDNHSGSRNSAKVYLVETISLNDLLLKYNAPQEIDYLSIDTEGSELLILKHFNFDKYRIKLITVEHNYTPIREGIYDLLVSKGYKRIREEYSQFDDWYVLKD